MSRPLRIAVLEHERASPAGLFGSWALARGHELDTIEVPELERWPAAGEHDLVLSLGSDCSVHASPDPWIAAEIEYVRECRRAEVPVLGICFGAQILAAALGGEVRKADRPDAGWRTVASADPDLITAGPWLCWHEDVFEPPPGAFEIARDELGSLAFRDGADLAIQFHPEVDETLVERWIEGSEERLLRDEVDAEVLRGESRQAGAGAERMAFDLFDRMAPLWNGG